MCPSSSAATRRHAGQYRQAQALLGGAPLAVAALRNKTGNIWEREGRIGAALRSYTGALAVLRSASDATDSTRLRAELTVSQGAARLRQGRHRDARALLEAAVKLAWEAPEDMRRVLAHAYRLLDWAHIELGAAAPLPYPELSAELYAQLDDEFGRASVLNNMGIAAYYRGEWDRAVELYRVSHTAAGRSGAHVLQATLQNNIAEILSDQGHIEEAIGLFHQALAVHRSAGSVMTGLVLSNLGRAAARAGQFQRAAERLQEAREFHRRAGAESQLVDADARDAERLLLAGESAAALALATQTFARAQRLGSMPYVLMLLERVMGCALAQSGDPETAWKQLQVSLLRSRRLDADYETALTLDALAQVGRPLGIDYVDELDLEARDIFSRLKVVAAPVVRMPVAAPIAAAAAL